MASKKRKAAENETQNEPLVEEVKVEEVVDEQTAEEVEEVEVEEVEEKDELTLAQEQVAELSDKHLRLQAEFDNYRKRTLKEKMELTKTAGERILLNIIPVMDDFERAMSTVESTDDIESVKDGLHLIYSKFEAFLTQSGIAAIPTENEVFDTDKHEAITQIPAPTKDLKGKIVDCVQKGYTLNDKVIRHSQVVIGE